MFFIYYFCEKYYKPITVQYYIADCVSWVSRLTLRTYEQIGLMNMFSEQNLFVCRRLTVVHANGNQRKAGVAILISDKIDFKIKSVTRDNERQYIMIKGSIQEEDNNCKYICTQHRSTSIYKANTNSHKGRN